MNYFISEYYLKTATTVSANVDIKDVNPFIPIAQDLFIKEILNGNECDDTFYNALLLSYTNQTLTPNEIILVSKIKPTLAWKACELALPALYIQIKNKGPQLQFGDNSSQVDQTQMQYLRNEITNFAELYQNALINYLKRNKSLFPALPTLKNQYQGVNSSFESGVAPYPESGCNFNWGFPRNFYS